ncbi:MAG: ABC transporter ATP-binding protein [Methanocalculus sp. MSAO_Arc1]|uniref:ABC transporter ATP-binding protein n=1 Tax=Methanocalculus TaxID=71151 RepID=UPI000FF74587|nr:MULTISPECIES: ABC transporter ATP-binding protein [unclassified Methanocalculus]MCP1661732.1 lipooligosaccharide transport system ATP-binding protein [Methanocalculus sp. AMF5]RQD79395.1 MAG: ABC transporter ATP-binding protein [Methanocalculus sp. MSAO_Arc1]
MDVIQAASLEKRYGTLKAVDGISFSVKKGEIFGFLGPNGAGKTTAMKMIHCVSERTSGELRVFDMDTNTHPREIKKRLGVVPQENNPDPDFSTYANLVIYARYFGIAPDVAEGRAEELLEFMQLVEKRDAPIETLSGGMKRRLIIARALINDPELLILDEPTIGLDPQARHLIWEKLRHLRTQGCTLVMTTHYLDEAERLCDRLVIMDHGRILVEGTPEELVRRYAGSDIIEAGATPAVFSCLDAANVRYQVFGDIVQVHTGDIQAVAHMLMESCSHERITLRRATLEDVFLKLTGRTLRE